MADRGGDRDPYVGAVAVWRWLTDPGTWRRFDGDLALRGVDPSDLSCGRLLRAGYAWLVAGQDEEFVARIDAILDGSWEAPPEAVPHFEAPAVGPGGVPVGPSVAQAAMPPAVSVSMLGLMDVMRTNTEVAGGG